MQNQSAATGNKTLAAVRGVLGAAWQLGQMDTETYLKACKVKNIKGAKPEQAAGRALTAGEFSARRRPAPPTRRQLAHVTP